jgi:hypothetical protein
MVSWFSVKKRSPAEVPLLEAALAERMNIFAGL